MIFIFGNQLGLNNKKYHLIDNLGKRDFLKAVTLVTLTL